MALQQGVSGFETQGDRNLAAHGASAVPAASVLPGESATPGERHSRASSLPTLKLKRGEKQNQRRAGGEKKAKGCLQGSFHAACFTTHQSRLLSRNRDTIQDKSGCYPRAPGTPLKGKF